MRKRARKSMKKKNLSAIVNDSRRVASTEVVRIAPPMFFRSAHSKELTGETPVTAHSKRVKVAAFSVSWEWLASADSKGVTGASRILIGKHIGTVHSKGVRRTAWRGRMVRRARRNRAKLTKAL